MKETKVYVDKMPEDCWDCLIHNGEDGHCKILNNFTDYISKDCPLIDIKDHDRELVRQVCEKIRRKVDNISMHTTTKERLMIMCEEIQQEFEDENNKN